LVPVETATDVDHQRNLQIRRLLHVRYYAFDQLIDIRRVGFKDQLVVNLNDHQGAKTCTKTRVFAGDVHTVKQQVFRLDCLPSPRMTEAPRGMRCDCSSIQA
jgi:hypothetical protein